MFGAWPALFLLTVSGYLLHDELDRPRLAWLPLLAAIVLISAANLLGQ